MDVQFTTEGVEMKEPEHAVQSHRATVTAPEYVEFWPAGTMANGRFRCAACGNAVGVRTVLPRCMLCGERLWEREESSPFAEGTGPH